MEIEVSEIRKQLREMYQTYDFDGKFYFFYDESGNVRKLYMDKQKINASLCDYFILGGLVFDSEPEDFKQIKIELNNYLTLPNEELKSAFVCTKSKDFICTLKQKKLAEFLHYCIDKKFHIHFQSFNLLYWSVVDIIDSIGLMDQYGFEEQNQSLLKNLIYLVFKENIVEVPLFFKKYDYPDIKKEQSNCFIDELIQLVKKTKCLFEDNKNILISFLVKGYNKKLIFVSDNDGGVLIEDFLIQYMDSIEKYINSIHLFDEESNIQKLLIEYDYTIKNEDAVIKNYSFLNSKSNFYLQMSDVIVGIIHRLKLYLMKYEICDIDNHLSNLSNIQKENLQLLVTLIQKSEDFSKFFILNIDACDEINKLAYLIKKIAP